MNFKKLVIAGLTAGVAMSASLQVQARDLVMGLIPSESNEDMVARFEPMREYLEQKTGEKIKLFTATDYSGVIEAMRKKRVDIAWFGPLSYVLAEREANAEAFAVGVRAKTGRSSYRAMILVPGDSEAKSLDDLKGKSVAFVDPASTSGGLMPTYVTKSKTGEMPKAYYGKLTWAGSHDAAQMAVKNGTVDAAGSNDITYGKMLNKGLFTADQVKPLFTSDPIPGSPLTYRKDLDADLKRKIRDAILYAHYEIDVTGYGKLLKYEQAAPADYAIIRDLVQQMGMGREDILK